MAWLWTVMRPWAMPILKQYCDIKQVEGKKHIPKKGAAILASNHCSGLDHVVLPILTRRTIYNISKIEHFHSPIKGWFFRHWGVIPLDRGRGDNAALEQAKDVLRRGDLFCIYPEGTRSLDGKLHKGHTGVARLALECGVPVIPVAMIGTFDKKPKGHKGVQKGVVTGAVAGPPMDFSEHFGKQADRKVCREVTDQIMHAIAQLSGQEYVDEYQYNPVYDKPSRKKRREAEAAEEADLAVEHRG